MIDLGFRMTTKIEHIAPKRRCRWPRVQVNQSPPLVHFASACKRSLIKSASTPHRSSPHQPLFFSQMAPNWPRPKLCTASWHSPNHRSRSAPDASHWSHGCPGAIWFAVLVLQWSPLNGGSYAAGKDIVSLALDLGKRSKLNSPTKAEEVKSYMAYRLGLPRAHDGHMMSGLRSSSAETLGTFSPTRPASPELVSSRTIKLGLT